MPSHPGLHPRWSSLAGRDASCSNDKVSKGCSKVSAESVAALGQTSVQAVLPWSNGCHRLARMVSIHANAIWSNSIRAELILVVCTPVAGTRQPHHRAHELAASLVPGTNNYDAERHEQYRIMAVDMCPTTHERNGTYASLSCMSAVKVGWLRSTGASRQPQEGIGHSIPVSMGG